MSCQAQVFLHFVHEQKKGIIYGGIFEMEFCLGT